MYARPTDQVDSRAAALEILEAASFVHLVSMGSDGFDASSLPMVVDAASDRLIGHLARANGHWRALDGQPVLVIAVASQSYVSPSWYASKRTSGGRVVPTWNYEAVHVHGVARLHHEPEWLAAVVGRLTERHESRRTDGSERWAVSDAPADFIEQQLKGIVEQQLKGIVGLSVSLDRVEAKAKLSANRDRSDRAGVVEGLSKTLDAPRRMIEQMSRSLDEAPE